MIYLYQIRKEAMRRMMMTAKDISPENNFLHVNSRSKEADILAAVLRNPDTALRLTLMLSTHPKNKGRSQGEVMEVPTQNLWV